MRALTERIAILGATSSIGRALANEFAAQGARVIVAGRDQRAEAGLSHLAKAPTANGIAAPERDQ